MAEDEDEGQNEVRIFDVRERRSAHGNEAVRGADRLHVGGEAARDKDDEADACNLRRADLLQERHQVEADEAG